MVMRAAEDMERSVFHPAKFARAPGVHQVAGKRDEPHGDNFRRPEIPRKRNIQVRCQPTQQLQLDLGFGVQLYLPSHLLPSSWVTDSGSRDQKQFPSA